MAARPRARTPAGPCGARPTASASRWRPGARKRDRRPRLCSRSERGGDGVAGEARVLVLLRAARSRRDRARRPGLRAGSGGRRRRTASAPRRALAGRGRGTRSPTSSPAPPGRRAGRGRRLRLRPGRRWHRATWTGFAPASLIVPEISLRPSRHGDLAHRQRRDRARRHRRGCAGAGRQAAGRAAGGAAAAGRPGAGRSVRGVQPDAARAFRAGRPAGDRADRRRRVREGRACARGRRPCAVGRTIPRRCSGLLREAFPSSFVYAVGRGDATFIGATPELLVRRQGQRASTVALAGSTRRSADPGGR